MAKYDAYRTFFLSIGILLLSFGMKQSHASEVEKWLLMPGDVVQSHANIEAECSLCHAPLSEVEQWTLCVDCHTGVAEDLGKRTGYHGRVAEDQRFECASCHTDHEGRDASIVIFDDNTFDHSLTDFILRGAHVNAGCAGCHSPGSAHSEALSECVDCHKPDDVHNGTLGDNCGSCHNESEWGESRFDHSQSLFPLTGAHSQIECDTCHLSPVFSEVERTCAGCHAEDDVHKGRNGNECATCHLTDRWASITFDHLTASGFALTGGHDNLTCQSCHRQDDHRDLGDSTCQTCHASDDVHKGRFGNDCASCHNVRVWSAPAFDHSRQTDFDLPDGHRELACSSCHSGSLTDPLPRDCGSCHRDNDPHKGQLGSECESCHVANSWTAQLWFDHDISGFPLLGAHSEVTCEQCHATAAFRDAETSCDSCHLDDDVHAGGLGTQCASCHNPSSWHAWLFDHDQDTAFALTGAHRETGCATCHIADAGKREPLSQDCVSCHSRDDPHDGRFGDTCANCHNSEDFSQIGDR